MIDSREDAYVERGFRIHHAYRRWLQGMRILEGIAARTEMVMDVNQVGDARVENLENLVTRS